MTCANPTNGPDSTLDHAEVERFSAIASEWWDPDGKFRPLHKIGPARIQFVRDKLCRHYARRPRDDRPLQGLTILDIGCGGGLVAEPLARLGATVTGLDPSKETIGAAMSHAASQGLDIEYRACRAEDLGAEGRTFDGVVCLEVVEHVPDVGAFTRLCADLVRPGGMLVLSTINRTAKSFALAIVGAEYILGWLPRGTHQWSRFVKPDELKAHCAASGLDEGDIAGLTFNPLVDEWSLGSDTGVNYMLAAAKAG